MDLSGEVANIHMRTDAKNLVTTARTIHLPDQQETMHMTSVLRSVFPQSVRKQVQTLSFVMCQRISAAFSSTTRVPSTERVNSGDQRT